MRQGAPINDERSELLRAGWRVRTNKPRYGWTFESLEGETEIWTCSDCARRLDKEAGVHYPFRRHASKRKMKRRPIELTIQHRQAGMYAESDST